MQIGDPVLFADWCQRQDDESLRLIAHPETQTEPDSDMHSIGAPQFNLPSRVRIAIGPEGGFTAAEVQQATSLGWRCLSLGRPIFRIETAAVVAAVHYCLAATFSRTRYISRHGN